jgi:hypothetical protein
MQREQVKFSSTSLSFQNHLIANHCLHFSVNEFKLQVWRKRINLGRSRVEKRVRELFFLLTFLHSFSAYHSLSLFTIL